MAKCAGKVYLVGAGPGASDLITVRGARVMRHADVVVYDNLVNPGLLRLAPATAMLIYAGKRAGAGATVEQPEINAMLIDHASRGKNVARLKGGDPFIFGRGGEEAEALADAGIAFEVIPGITSAIAAPAFAGIPLTHRDHGSFVAFVAGHEDEGKPAGSSVPWNDLARAANCGGTIVILMATTRLARVVEKLVSGGLDPATPAAAIQWATIADQKTVSSPLSTLAAEVQRARLGAPAVIVVGESAGLREHLKWAERMPLFGRRIVVTRASRDASRFARELQTLGAEAVEFPTIEVMPPDSYEVLDGAISRIGAFDWLIFTSATGVESFIDRIRDRGLDIRAIGKARIGAIGPATAKRLADFALLADAIPEEYRAEATVGAIGLDAIRGARILLPRAQVAREVLPAMLTNAGAAEVVVAPAYKTVQPSGAAIDRIREVLLADRHDLVAFTSSSTVSNFVAAMGSPKPGTRAAAIGPITRDTAKKLGFEVVVMPSEYTVAALVVAIRQYFVSSASPQA